MSAAMEDDAWRTELKYVQIFSFFSQIFRFSVDKRIWGVVRKKTVYLNKTLLAHTGEVTCDGPGKAIAPFAAYFRNSTR